MFQLEEREESLLTGMSAKVTVFCREARGVLTVPVEAVFEREGKFFCYARAGDKPQQKFVELGEANARRVAVKAGLAEGEEVYLFDPQARGPLE